MKAELRQILDEYAAFETVVGQEISNFCAPHCSVCELVCCRPEFCRETIDSPFLNLLNARVRRNAAYSAQRGWQTSSGCALPAGRPPVCYQFNCDKILDTLPDDLTRYLARVLSNLVPHIGKRALGDRHLVEVMDPARLEKVKYSRFSKRLEEARKALQAIQSVKRPGVLPASSRRVLSKISPIPPSLSG
jgi:hypothetical protein